MINHDLDNSHSYVGGEEQIKMVLKGIIDRQKQYVRVIDFKILLLNSVVAILTMIQCIAFLFPRTLPVRWAYETLLPAMLIFTCFILLYSVLKIRRTIKEIAYAFPNEKLMCVHLINFVVWSVLVILQTILSILAVNLEEKVDPNVPSQDKLEYF